MERPISRPIEKQLLTPPPMPNAERFWDSFGNDIRINPNGAQLSIEETYRRIWAFHRRAIDKA